LQKNFLEILYTRIFQRKSGTNPVAKTELEMDLRFYLFEALEVLLLKA
jgi:hypothetical protein